MKITNGWLDVALDGHYRHKSMSRQGYKPTMIVLHSTAGGSSAQAIDNYFSTSDVQASAHFIIGQDGTIVQGIGCDQASWSNGTLTPGHAPFLPQSINPNLYTISIEHVKSSTDNSNQLTERQQDASFKLIECLCNTYNIPKRAGDTSGGIISHAQLDPINRSRCPGPFPWEQLWAFLKEGNNMGIPQGWSDSGAILTAPNGKKSVFGFRDYILGRNWDPANVPLENEHGVAPAQLHRQDLGDGTRQCFRDSVLWWTSGTGVVCEKRMGEELFAAYALIDKATSDLATANAQITALHNQSTDLLAQNTDLENRIGVMQGTISSLEKQIAFFESQGTTQALQAIAIIIDQVREQI